MRVLRVAGLMLVSILAVAAGSLVSPAAAEPTGPPPVPAVVGLDAASFGSKLVDGNGVTLYVFSLDAPGTSNCSGDCAREWPPLRSAGGKPLPGPGVTASDIGSTLRPDGSDQVTFEGYPLYYYSKDVSPGDIDGHGVSAFGGEWSAAPPAPSGTLKPGADTSVIHNGGFEDGLNSWTAAGISPPSITTIGAHGTNGSAAMGVVSGAEPLGDSSLSQTITVPTGSSTLSFWYWPATTDDICSGVGCEYDWQEAQIRDAAGVALASVFRSNSDAQAWTQVSYDTSAYAGQSIVLWFNVHSDGATPADDTSMYLDDVTLTGSTPTAPSDPVAQPASPSFVQQASAHVGLTGSIAVTPSAPITAGDRLVVLIGVWNDNGPSTISVVDSAGNAYVKLTQFEASDKTEMSVWTAPITQGGGTTPTVTATPSGSADLGIQVLEYSGLSQVADATVVDQLSTATGSTESTPVTVRSGETAATTAANELALGFYLDSGFGATLAAGAGFTLRGNISPSADMEFLAEDEMAMLGGSPNAGVATRGGVTWLMATVVLKHA